jgi:hypothetical protein
LLPNANESVATLNKEIRVLEMAELGALTGICIAELTAKELAGAIVLGRENRRNSLAEGGGGVPSISHCGVCK